MRIFAVFTLLSLAAQVGLADWRFAVAAYTDDGTPDPTFARNGRLVVLFPGANADGPVGGALDSQNRIVMAGTLDDKIGIVRYLPDGTPDTSFNGTGTLVTDFGTGSEVSGHEIFIDACDQIWITFQQNNRQRSVARLLPDGSLDPTFGVRDNPAERPYAVTTEGTLGAQRWTARLTDPAGKTTTVGEGLGEANAIQAGDGGNIVIAGMVAAPRYRFSIWRRTPEGNPDSSFGVDGNVTAAIPGTFVSRATTLAMQGRKPTVAGYGYTDATFARTAFTLARFNSDGSLDTTFNGTGTVVTQMSCKGSSQADTVLIQDLVTTTRVLAIGRTQHDPCDY